MSGNGKNNSETTMKNIILVSKRLLFSVVFLFVACGQEKATSTEDAYFALVREDYKGDLAFATTKYVAQYWRVVGNTGFNNSVHYITKHLDSIGYIEEGKAKSTDRLTYRVEKRALEHPTWEPVSARLKIEGEETPLLSSDTNRNMTYLNSASTPEEGITSEVVHLIQDTDLDSLDVKGKVVYSSLTSRKLFKQILEGGALGVITYNNPDYLQPEKNTTAIQFRSLPAQIGRPFWGIALSYAANETLKKELEKGKTKVHVNIQTKIYPSEELTVVANVKGRVTPKERLVFSAHIQEPGANDNASGVGAQLEMATVMAKLIKEGKVDANRTLTFLWGDEIVSTRRYIEEDKERAKDIKWGISLDMVGENTALTGGSFLIEKMPDPSAIWTRGNDKHTEWGGRELSLEEMKPHYLNDFILDIFKKQGIYANWEVATNPFEGGSDHTPFLKADIPGLLLWHFTDQFYHTDQDKIDKVSKETLTNVGTGALVAALTLVNADDNTALRVASQIKEDGLKRLEEEYTLSAAAIQQESTKEKELQIIRAWEDWYIKALFSVKDMAQQPSEQLNSTLEKYQKDIQESVTEFTSQLKK